MPGWECTMWAHRTHIVAQSTGKWGKSGERHGGILLEGRQNPSQQICHDSGVRGRRKHQGLGQKPVSRNQAHTQDKEAVARDLWDLSPIHVADTTPSQEPLTPKGSYPTSGTNPKGLTHLLQMPMEMLLRAAAPLSQRSLGKPVAACGVRRTHSTEFSLRCHYANWLISRGKSGSTRWSCHPPPNGQANQLLGWAIHGER